MEKNKKAVCTVIIAVVNVAVFLGLSLFGRTEDGFFMLQHGAMYVPSVLEDGEYYRLFTSMFLHFGFEHLMNNMVTLCVIGWNLELEIGKWKYLLIYFASGLCGNLLSAAGDMMEGRYVLSAGASGAIFGLIGALLCVAVKNKGRIGRISSKRILFMILYSLCYGFTTVGVDNLAHIGGLAAGVALAALLYRKPKRTAQSVTEEW